MNIRQSPAGSRHTAKPVKTEDAPRHFREWRHQQSSGPTWKDEDEEGADATDDTDDLTHVRDKHCDEESDRDPDHGQNNATVVLERPCYHGDAAPDTQQQILNYRPV